MEEAVQNHNKNLDALLERCWTNRVKLNAQKARLRLCEVYTIHIMAERVSMLCLTTSHWRDDHAQTF